MLQIHEAGMVGPWQVVIILIITLPIFYFIIRKKKEKKSDEIKNSEKIEKKDNIATQCPHCKNPNTKKLRICEWCGNNIC